MMATANKKARKITLFNPSAMPVVYTDQGHILGGGERCEVDALDETGRTVVKQGYLLDQSDEGERTEQASNRKEENGASDQEQGG
jgi:hypothetical protein